MGAGIGISGVHRSGKSTLMAELAKVSGMRPLPTKVGDVFKDMGLPADQCLDLHTRLDVQIEILRRMRALLTEARAAGNFIADRTPLDLVAYTLADIGPSTIGDHQEQERKRLLGYINDCYSLTNEFFSFVVILQPGIAIKHEPHKGSVCPVFIEHFNMLMLGAARDQRCKVQRLMVPRNVTDLKARTDTVVNAIANDATAFTQQTIASFTVH